MATLFLLLGLGSPALGQQSSLAEHPAVASNLALLEAWIDAQNAYSGVPGVAVGIVHDQDLIYAKGFGYADVENEIPCDTNTTFQLASHAKLFIAIAILQLRDEGKLRLDDPVEQHLPWLSIEATPPDADPITIWHLLTHSSGLPRDVGSAFWITHPYPTREQIIERIKVTRAILPAESRFKYSNVGNFLCGEIISTASHQPYADYVASNILSPLEMNATYVAPETHQRTRMAAGYGRRMPDGSRPRIPFLEVGGIAPAGGMTSSVADMAKFISWQFRLRKTNTNEVIRSSTLKEMQRVHWMWPEWNAGSGLGFHILNQPHGVLIGHDGLYAGYKTATYIDVERKIGVVVLTNAMDAEPWPGQPGSITDRIFEWVGPAVESALSDAAAPVPEAWSALTGTYRSVLMDLHVLPLDGKLTVVDPTAPNPRQFALTLEPSGDGGFILDARGPESGYEPLGERVEFERDSEGRVIALSMPNDRFERVSE